MHVLLTSSFGTNRLNTTHILITRASYHSKLHSKLTPLVLKFFQLLPHCHSS